MNDGVFRRYEEKYLLSEEDKYKLFQEINKYLEEDEYFKSKICSIYFDNDNNDLIINSLEKPIYKDKIRLRSYGIPNINDNVFLEIKNKYKGITGKRRIKIKLKDFNEYIENNNNINNSQIMKELDYLFKYYHLKPSMYISYDRLSYVGKSNDYLRITLDSNLKARQDNLKLDYGDYGKRYFKDNYYIMEIKTLGSIPLWLTRSLNKLGIFPTSFSKYGNFYKKYIEEMV